MNATDKEKAIGISQPELCANKSFESAATMVSSTDRKSNSIDPEHMAAFSANQFKADLSTNKRSLSSVSKHQPVRKIWPQSSMTLERQPSGIPIDFDLYDE